MFSITSKFRFLEKISKQSAVKMNQNYWTARKGNSDLRHLEQLFSILLLDHADIFEAIDIYTRLRNDQYKSIEEMLRSKPELKEQIVHFIKLLIHSKTLSPDDLQIALTLYKKITKNEQKNVYKKCK